MNKNKGIRLVIAAILVIGIGITFATSSFVNRNRGSLDGTQKEQPLKSESGLEAGQAYDGAGAAFAPDTVSFGDRTPGASKKAAGRTVTGTFQGGKAPGDKSAGSRERPIEGRTKNGEKSGEPAEHGAAGGDLPGTATASAALNPASNQSAAKRAAVPGGRQTGQDGNGASPEGAPSSPDMGGGSAISAAPVISPLGPGSKSADGDPEEKKAYYNRLLLDLDTQIQNMRSESSDSTTYSMKTMADKELKLWNVEMNLLYTDILKAADDDAKGKLESSQQNWMKSRDAKAEAAAKKYSGGTLEGVEYTASLAESTRKRAYELVEKYIDLLPAE